MSWHRWRDVPIDPTLWVLDVSNLSSVPSQHCGDQQSPDRQNLSKLMSLVCREKLTLCDWCCLWLEDLGPFKPRCSSIEAAATCTHGKGTEQGEGSLKQANDVQVYLHKDGPLPLYRGRRLPETMRI